MRKLTKVVAFGAVPAMAVAIALPAFSALASTKAPVLPTPTHVSASATDQGNGSDNVAVSWNYGHYKGVRFEVVEHRGTWSTNAAVTSGHSVTLHIGQGSLAHDYTFSVYAFRKGFYKSAMSWKSSPVSIPALPPVTIAIVNPTWAAAPLCSAMTPTDTLSYSVTVTGYSPVTEIDTYITGVQDIADTLATDTLSAGSVTGNVGSPAMSLTRPAPVSAPPAIALTVELMNGTQLLATSAPVYTTAPHCV